MVEEMLTIALDNIANGDFRQNLLNVVLKLLGIIYKIFG
jgi:hypothetical protein